MSKLIALSTVFAVFLVTALSAQQSKSLLTHKDSLFMFVHKNETKVLMHTVKKGQTLFSIGQFYGITEPELMAYNPWFKGAVTQLSPGDKVNVPVPNRAIHRYVKSKDLKKFAPLYYIVQAGDNLFQISTTHMHMTVAEIKKQNKLTSDQVKPGQLLLVGWVPIAGVPREWRETKSHGQLTAKGAVSPKTYTAVWVKDKNAVSGNFCLTNEAKKGTKVQVTNIANNKAVEVTVVGGISSSKSKKTQVVLSEVAAQSIGLTDKDNQVTLSAKN